MMPFKKLPFIVFAFYYCLPEDNKLLEAILNVPFKKLFILDCLSLVKDYARTEDEAAHKKIIALINEVYESLPLPCSCASTGRTVDFIFKNI